MRVVEDEDDFVLLDSGALDQWTCGKDGIPFELVLDSEVGESVAYFDFVSGVDIRFPFDVTCVDSDCHPHVRLLADEEALSITEFRPCWTVD